MKSWSLTKEIRQEIIQLSKGRKALSARKVGKIYGINPSTVRNIINPEATRAARLRYLNKNWRWIYKQNYKYLKEYCKRPHVKLKIKLAQRERYRTDPVFRKAKREANARYQRKLRRKSVDKLIAPVRSVL